MCDASARSADQRPTSAVVARMCEGAGRPRACASARRKQAALWLKRPPSSMPKTKSRHLPPRVSSVGVFFAPACLVECSTGASAVLPSWFPVGCEGGTTAVSTAVRRGRWGPYGMTSIRRLSNRSRGGKLRSESKLLYGWPWANNLWIHDQLQVATWPASSAKRPVQMDSGDSSEWKHCQNDVKPRGQL